jgi:cytochrome c
MIAAALASPASADPASDAPHLGTPMSKEYVAKWNLTIFPDGRGLPPGRGTAKEGAPLYAAACASCHGAEGEGGTAEELVSEPKPPSSKYPSKAIGAYWPYATTIFDYIRRAMPPAAPGSLSADQVYALTAYLLAANRIIGEDAVIDAETLPKIKMPNRDGFVWIDVNK